MANSRLCSIPGCGKPRDSHGYCGAHAQRFRRHGDPLGGGTGHHEPMRFIENISAPYEGEDCLIWPFGRTNAGYAQIHIGDTTAHVARIICEKHHGPPPTPEHEAAHSCGRGHLACINPNHLSWKTHKDNEADKLMHGTHQFGERNTQAKLTSEHVDTIRRLRGRETQQSIADRFGISQSLVSLIQSGKLWPGVPPLG